MVCTNNFSKVFFVSWEHIRHSCIVNLIYSYNFICNQHFHSYFNIYTCWYKLGIHGTHVVCPFCSYLSIYFTFYGIFSVCLNCSLSHTTFQENLDLEGQGHTKMSKPIHGLGGNNIIYCISVMYCRDCDVRVRYTLS